MIYYYYYCYYYYYYYTQRCTYCTYVLKKKHPGVQNNKSPGREEKRSISEKNAFHTNGNTRRAAYRVHVLKVHEHLEPQLNGICTRPRVSSLGSNVHSGSRALKIENNKREMMPGMRENDDENDNYREQK